MFFTCLMASVMISGSPARAAEVENYFDLDGPELSADLPGRSKVGFADFLE
jgi:hypothetical protein